MIAQQTVAIWAASVVEVMAITLALAMATIMLPMARAHWVLITIIIIIMDRRRTVSAQWAIIGRNVCHATN